MINGEPANDLSIQTGITPAKLPVTVSDASRNTATNYAGAVFFIKVLREVDSAIVETFAAQGLLWG